MQSLRLAVVDTEGCEGLVKDAVKRWLYGTCGSGGNVMLDKLLESYDPIDIAYDKRFSVQEPAYASFITTKEEAEKILLIEPLKGLVET